MCTCLCISTVTCTSGAVCWPEGELSTVNHLIIKRQWKRWLDFWFDVLYHYFHKTTGYHMAMNCILVWTDLPKANRLPAALRQQHQFSFNTSSAFSCSWNGCENMCNAANHCNSSSIITFTHANNNAWLLTWCCHSSCSVLCICGYSTTCHYINIQ